MAVPDAVSLEESEVDRYASKSHYFEGDSIPYRMLLDNLDTTSAHALTIQWDTTKSGKHALDYLTTWNRSVTAADPCAGVAGCSLATFTSWSIPADPNVTGAGVTPTAGSFTLFGGTITGVSAYTLSGPYSGDSSTSITISFTAAVADPVLAWGGHVATRADWGMTGSAVNISGSPYHMRLLDLDGSGGNQDRSLSEDAVIFPGSITIIKDATPNGNTSFPSTASPAPLADFSLVDDGTAANTKTFSNIIAFTTYTVTETPIATGWAFDSVLCTVTSPNGGSTSTSGASVRISMAEGENWTCTFSNSQLSIATTLSKSSGSIGDSVHDSAALTGATSNAGGTVKYTVYTNNLCTLGAIDAGTKAVTAGVVPDSNAIAFNSAGNWYWQAVYSGDANNGGATSACTSETLVISPTPFQTVLADTATPGHSTTPPPTSSGSNGSSGDSTPLFAILICLAFGGLGLAAVEAQRRAIRS